MAGNISTCIIGYSLWQEIFPLESLDINKISLWQEKFPLESLDIVLWGDIFPLVSLDL